MHANFIHLKLHTQYSLAEGAIRIVDAVKLAVKHKMPALAITDSANLFGALEFSKECAKNGVQPIIASIIAVEFGQKNKSDLQKITLYAKNDEGYRNLLKLVSLLYISDHKGFVTIDNLMQYNEGIICISPHNLELLHNIFPHNFYAEISRLGYDGEDEKEEIILDLAYQHNIPIVATNEIYFASPEMHEAHDALICIADGRYISEEERRKFTNQHYFKTPEEMEKLFEDLPEAIANTIIIAKRCGVMAEEHEPMLPRFAEGDEVSEFRNQSLFGLIKRIGEKTEENQHYFERLEFELDVIIKMNFPGYFLIVSDFIKWSKDHHIPVGPGRGSGAGSIVAWALEITDLDPIRFGLLFERFLNPERVSMPDFDIDFCQEKRDKVIEYVQRRYGHERVAQIITFGKLQARAVLRDVGRVLQMPYGQVDKICKLIPFNPIDPVTLSKAIQMDKELQRQRDDDPEIAKLLSIGLQLEGLNRHASTHAAGVVISQRPIDEIVALYRDPRSEMNVVQYSMKYAESAGLVKFDFLGLKTLTVIAKTCELVNDNKFSIENIPLDDPKTFEMLSSGDAVGVFQFESAGMRDSLRKLKPDRLEDLIALGALYRPGPMDNIPSYIARKHGLEQPDYLHPWLEEVLKETYGVIIYQEQVMEIAKIIGGYSLGAADLLRRAMGKKIKAEMDAQKDLFINGAIAKGVSKEQASSLFDLVEKFAGYGFNKSHAAAYGLISYRTAYLKANYKVEFLTASMNLEIDDTDKLSIFRQEAISSGIKILPPDINKSESLFSAEDGNIRYGLGALRNVGLEATRQIAEERKKNGDYKDIFDLAERNGSKALNKRALENLAKAGAFDQFSTSRRKLHDSAEIIIRYAASFQEEKNSNQISLFDVVETNSQVKPKLAEVKEWPQSEKLTSEYEALGCYLSAHPLDSFGEKLKKAGVVMAINIADKIAQFGGGGIIKLAGVVVISKHRSTAKGRFAFGQISDPTGIFEISIYSEDLIIESRELFVNGQAIMITADARKDEGNYRLIATKIEPLSVITEGGLANLKLELLENAKLEQLKNIFGDKLSNGCKIILIANSNGKKVEIELPGRYKIVEEQAKIIEELDSVKYCEYS